MPPHSLTVRVPDPLYGRLQQRAEQTRRTVEIELLEALAAAIPVDEGLPPDLAHLLEPLPSLDDAALWTLARERLQRKASARLESLHLKGQRVPLTDNEAQEERQLMNQYEHAILVRAEAVRLLRERGHDVSGLIARR